MRLIIAEKPLVAEAIAAAFGGGQKTSSCYTLASGDKVCWLYGHILRLGEPEDHNPAYKKWSLADLPLQWPIRFYLQPEHQAHYQALVALASQAQEVIHAGDPDPEGQRVVDEFLEFAGLTEKPCLRVLINDNNPAPIRAAFAAARDNKDFQSLSQAALARAVCDQRYGFNLTRAYTLAAKACGTNSVLSVGRVQTPILGLVVARDKAHEGHSPSLFYQVQAQLRFHGFDIIATYQPEDGTPINEQGHLITKALARIVQNSVRGQPALITHAQTCTTEKTPSLPYNLLALQADAAELYRYSPWQVMELTQSLRDKHRAITYNRSDCRYLNADRHAEAPALLAALSPLFAPEVAGANPDSLSKAFDSKKVSAHHAIIPTRNVPSPEALSPEEWSIYRLIVRQYIAQFYPPEQWRSTELSLLINGHHFKAKGRTPIAAGWRDLYGAEDDQDDGEDDDFINSAPLEGLSLGEQGQVHDVNSRQETTQPPARYRMKTLLQDLTQVAKYVQDPDIRALLLAKDADKHDERGGIGTPATRDSHIETLFKRGFLEEKDGNIQSTALGRAFHDSLPSLAVTPDLTALWHQQQHAIEEGTLDFPSVIQAVDATIYAEIERVKRQGISLSPAPSPQRQDPPALYHCPRCAKPLHRRPAKRTGLFWWGCSGYPTCDYRAFDDNGAPKSDRQEGTALDDSPGLF